MKKTLLSFIAVWLSVITALASEHTIVFDGTGDQYGLTRLTTAPTATSTFVTELSFTEEDVSFSIEKTSTTGYGFALVNAGGANAGLCVYSSFTSATQPSASLTVPNGKITKVRLYLSGSALTTLAIDFNGEESESTGTDGSLYYWDWSNTEGVETLNFKWDNKWYARYIHSIEVTYTEDLGGKQECGLAFSASEAEAIEGKDFTEPTLDNPNDLEVTWSSSNEAVATVNENGELTLVGGGSAVITAATAGNDEFAKGNAKYTINVIPSASNIAELIEKAPDVNNQVYVNFPVTVTYGSGSFAYVLDAEDNAGYINDGKNDGNTGSATTIYKPGDVIPAGWIATNSSKYELTWKGLPPAVTENKEVAYPEVESLDYEKDACEILILKDVTFSSYTAVGETKAYGTTPDGTRYEFQNNYNAPELPAGTYDVVVAVRYSKVGSSVYAWLSPIKYYPAEFPEEFNITADPATLNISQDYDEGDITIIVDGSIEGESASLTFELPAGWDGLIGAFMPSIMPFSANSAPAKAAAPAEGWTSMEDFKAEYEGFELAEGVKIELPVDGMQHMGMFWLYAGDQVCEAHRISIAATVSMPAPAIPEEFDVTLSCDGLNVTKEMKEEWGEIVYSVVIDGECDAEEVTISLPVPEGWDGFYCATDDGEVSIAKAPKKVDAPTEITWYPISYVGMLDAEEGNAVTFPADGEEYQAIFYLYKGENFVANFGVNVKVEVTQKEPGLEFPDEFNITVSPEGLDVKQDSEYGYTINVEGTTDEKEVSVTLEVPEGWDGFIGGPNPYAFMSKVAKAPVSEDEEAWVSVDDMIEYYNFEKTNTFTAPADGAPHYYMICLYKGDKVYTGEYMAAAISLTVEVEGPEELTFPEKFEATVSADGLEMTKGVEQGIYSINVKGETEEEAVTVTVAVPDGWDGFITMGEPENPGIDPLKAKIAKAADDDEEEWYPIDAMLEAGFQKTNEVTLPADGEEHIAQLYLYKGDMVYMTSRVDVYVEVSNPEPAPEFPAAFEATVSVEGLEMTKGTEQGIYTISVKGESEEEAVTVTVTVPEGWDGFIGMSADDYDPDINPLAKIAKAADEDEEAWAPVEAMLQFGMRKTNALTFAVDGDEHNGQLYLYKGDMVYIANRVDIYVEVSKPAAAEPEFPASIDVTADSETVTISQEADEDNGGIMVVVSGKTDKEEVTLTFDLPEGWDSLIGNLMPMSAEPVVQSRAAEDWVSIEDFKAAQEGEELIESNVIVVPADGKPYVGQFCLCAGDKVYTAQGIMLSVSVAKSTSGIGEIEAEDGDVRYFNIHGVEVVNPESGIYIKVANGKVSKVAVK